MAGGRRGERSAYWRELLVEQQASGLPVTAFCRERGVSDASFYAWRRRLQSDGQAKAAERPDPAGAQFVTVPLSSAELDFEVRLPNGMVVTVPRGFDEAALQRLLQTAASVERGDA